MREALLRGMRDFLNSSLTHMPIQQQRFHCLRQVLNRRPSGICDVSNLIAAFAGLPSVTVKPPAIRWRRITMPTTKSVADQTSPEAVSNSTDTSTEAVTNDVGSK